MSFGTIPMSLDDKPDGFVLLSMYEKLESENAKLRKLVRNLRRVLPADVVGVVIGANTDHPSYYKFDEAFRELRIEVENDS